VTEGLFRIGPDGEVTLHGGWSPSSRLAHFPPGPVCPYTGADDVEVRDLPRTGRLWLWTAVTNAPPGYHGPVPYGIGIVELDDVGLRVVGRLTEADPLTLREGMRMEVVAAELPDGDGGTVTVWAFSPSDDGAGSPATGDGR
jgi:uncharacterized OB-fold protein